MEVSFYLKRPDADMPTAIFARISYDGLQLKYYIAEKIHPKYWNKQTHQVRKQYENYGEFNRRLKNIANDIDNEVRTYKNNNNGQIPSVAILKELLEKLFKNTSSEKLTFISFFQKIIEDSKQGIRLHPKTGKPINKNTIKTYVTTFKHLQEYQALNRKRIDFDTIDLDFYGDYTEYLIKVLKLATNTVGKHIQVIKLVMNDATEHGINTNLTFKSKRFVTIREKVDSIYLNEDEVKLFEKLDLSKQPKLERVRDLFLIGCYTGLRFSDYSILNPEQIKDGFIETTQIKTGDPVVIPIHDTVTEIINKYSGVLPKAISNQKTNDYLKELTKKIPEMKAKVPINYTKAGQKVIQNFEKWELVTTHTARRSFATNEFKAGTPSITIMAITGHKTEKAFLRYIKVTPNEHARILKASWDKRNKTKTIALTA